MILVVTLDGGTGVTTAKTLHEQGREVMVTGLVDAGTGAVVRRDVLTAGPRESLFDLTGSRVSISDWADFVGGFYGLAARASVVVLTGGLPAGFPDDAFAQLTRTSPTPVVVDTTGEITLEELDAHADR